MTDQQVHWYMGYRLYRQVSWSRKALILSLRMMNLIRHRCFGLLKKGAEIDSKDIYSRTPLLCAVQNGHESIVMLLLEKDAEFETKDNKYGRTPLLWAVRNGYESISKLLLKKGAESDSNDIYRRMRCHGLRRK